MRKVITLLLMCCFVLGTATLESCSNKPQGKHHSHKGSKKKKSKYFHDFQH